MSIRWIFFALFSLCYTTSAVPDQIHGSDFGHNNWHGHAYTDTKTGVFSYCAVFAQYGAGEILMLSMTQNAKIFLGMIFPKTRFTTGHHFPVILYVDNRPLFRATGEVLDEDFLMIELTDFDHILQDLKKGHVVDIKRPGHRRFRYRLTGTRKAIEQMQHCVVKYDTYLIHAKSESIEIR